MRGRTRVGAILRERDIVAAPLSRSENSYATKRNRAINYMLAIAINSANVNVGAADEYE